MILYTERQRVEWVVWLCGIPLPVTVHATPGAKRSLAQNRTLHKWFGQIGEHMGDTAAGVKAECKLRFGLPIMEGESPAWVEKYSPVYLPMKDNYPALLTLFEFIPMTSEMNVKQMRAFMDAVQREYRAQGVDLIDPDAKREL